MKSSSLALAAQLVTSACAFRLVQRETPRVVKADIHRRNVNPVEHDRLRRRDTVQVSLDNLETLYFMNASLGTPAQGFRLHIDTGSSDLWVNAGNSPLCSNRALPCDAAGVYSANDSSTYEFVNSVFNISYVDGSGASGDYARDTFSMDDLTIDNLQFGIGYKSSSPEGILGIGYMVNEVQVNRAGLDPYSNLPQKLVDDKKINTNAYSLWLNDLDASTGSILFGGVDTDKFEGTLSKLPIIPESGVYAEFIIALTALGADGDKGSIFQNEEVAVLLDSGSSLMYLPDNVATALYEKYDARYDSAQGAAFCDCDLANQEGSLQFTFSSDGPTISVPLNELVLVMGYQRGQPVCILGIGPSGDSISVLGDTFLRSAYVVYDLERTRALVMYLNLFLLKPSGRNACFGSGSMAVQQNAARFSWLRFRKGEWCSAALADPTAPAFASFLPNQVLQLKEPAARVMASRIQRLPVQTSFCDRPILTSCVPPLIEQRDGPPVLLLHGFDSSCLEWRRAYPLLEQAGFSPWAVDILGWGFSTSEGKLSFDAKSKTEHIYEFWKAYIDKPVVLVGPSLGGAASIQLAVSYPEIVSKLVLINPQGYVEGLGNMATLPKTVLYGGAAVLKSVPLRAYANLLIFSGLTYKTLLDLIQVGRLHCLMPGWADALVEFMASGGYNVASQIPQVQQETLLIWGEQDKIVPKIDTEKFLRDLPNARLHLIPDCGHIPHVENPDSIAALICEFSKI